MVTGTLRAAALVIGMTVWPLTAGLTLAQEVGARRTGANLTSPEIGSDRRVTFRLRAPDAKAATVSGATCRGDGSTWRASTGCGPTS